MATLGLKEMGKFLWEGREKSLPCWLSQFSFAKPPEVIVCIFFLSLCLLHAVKGNQIRAYYLYII